MNDIVKSVERGDVPKCCSEGDNCNATAGATSELESKSSEKPNNSDVLNEVNYLSTIKAFAEIKY